MVHVRCEFVGVIKVEVQYFASLRFVAALFNPFLSRIQQKTIL